MLRLVFVAFFLSVLFGGLIYWFTKPVPHGPYAKQTTIMAVVHGKPVRGPEDLDPCDKISLHNVQEGDMVLAFTYGGLPQGFTYVQRIGGVMESYHIAQKGETEFAFPNQKGKCGLVEIAR